MPNAQNPVTEIYRQIKDTFEHGDDGELLLTCPFDGESSYDLYPTKDGTWNIILDDRAEVGHWLNKNKPSLEAAKERVADLISQKLTAARDMVASAREKGIIPQ